MIIATDDMSDAHSDVVGHNRQVVDGAVVASENHEIIEIPSLEADASVHCVIPCDLLVLEQEADSRRGPSANPLLNLRCAEPVAAPVVAKAPSRCLGTGALCVELFPGAEATVCLTSFEQPLGIRLMLCRVLTLEVRPFIPGDPEPAKAIKNDLGVLWGAPLAVGILDAQDMCTPGMAGEEPVE
jgi:hypothetical protein